VEQDVLTAPFDLKLNNYVIIWVGNDPFFIEEINMDITIYTTEGCIWCSRLRELMDRANQEYNEIVFSQLSENEQEELKIDLDKKGYSDITAFPFAFIDGKFYRNLVEVAKLFLEKGLVSAPQK